MAISIDKAGDEERRIRVVLLLASISMYWSQCSLEYDEYVMNAME